MKWFRCAVWVQGGFCNTNFYTDMQKQFYCGNECNLCSWTIITCKIHQLFTHLSLSIHFNSIDKSIIPLRFILVFHIMRRHLNKLADINDAFCSPANVRIPVIRTAQLCDVSPLCSDVHISRLANRITVHGNGSSFVSDYSDSIRTYLFQRYSCVHLINYLVQMPQLGFTRSILHQHRLFFWETQAILRSALWAVQSVSVNTPTSLAISAIVPVTQRPLLLSSLRPSWKHSVASK